LTAVILELDEEQIRTGYATVTKVDDKGRRKGKVSLSDVADVLREVFRLDAEGRQVRMVSRFAKNGYLAYGQNGPKWAAVKELPPDDYVLVAGQAYKVTLPRLVAVVSNYSYNGPRIFWTPDDELTPGSKIYPLMIGNIDSHGSVCLGNTGLHCKTPEDMEKYVRQVVEAPANGHYLSAKTNVDKLYRALTKQWAPGIGRKHGTTLGKLLAETV